MGGTKQHRPFLLLLYFCGENKQIHLFRVQFFAPSLCIRYLRYEKVALKYKILKLPDLLHKTF